MWSVSDLFKTEGRVMPIALSGFSREDILWQFDSPDLLMIIDDPLGGEGVCLKTDEPHLRKRHAIVMQVFEELGIQGDNLVALGIERVLELRRLIDERMASE